MAEINEEFGGLTITAEEMELICGAVFRTSMGLFQEWQDDVNNIELQLLVEQFRSLIVKLAPISPGIQNAFHEGYKAISEMSEDELELVKSQLKHSDFDQAFRDLDLD